MNELDRRRYNDYIKQLPPGRLAKEILLTNELLIAKEDEVKVYYIPYNSVNEQAKVFIIGITPGFTQMEIAIRQARADMLNGVSEDEMYKRAKRTASFAGTMRTHLISMLDGLGLPDALGISTSASLFAERANLLHTTSVIRYPVFVKSKNYTGHQPDMLKSPLLLPFINGLFAGEVQSVEDALIIPLGKAVSNVLRHLAQDGIVSPDRCLLDFPHPSGANGHRKVQFERLKPVHQQQIREWFW